jgi:hypothetical protein
MPVMLRWEEVRDAVRCERSAGRNDGDEARLERRLLEQRDDAHVQAGERETEEDVSAGYQHTDTQAPEVTRSHSQSVVAHTMALHHEVG